MNREEFLTQASAYIGVAVGMRNGEMCIDGPHAIIEVLSDGVVFINAPEQLDFFEPIDGDYTDVYAQIVPMINKARIDFDKSAILLRELVAEHVAAIHPSICVSVSEDCNTCLPRATFYLSDTGIILYQVTMYGEYPDFEAYEGTYANSFKVSSKKINDSRVVLRTGLADAIKVGGDNFLVASDIHAFLGANLNWSICEFETSVRTSVQLPDYEVYKDLMETRQYKFVNFEVL